MCDLPWHGYQYPAEKPEVSAAFTEKVATFKTRV